MKTKMYLLLVGIISSMLSSNTYASEQTKPNIIVILLDDLGYADLGKHGIVDDIKTPNLDKLAKSGVMCTSGYITAPQCSPSRAGLITGRYQQRFGIDAIADTPLPLKEITIAEHLNKAGYTSGMVGKWHLDPSFSSVAWLRNHPEAVVKDEKFKIGRNISQNVMIEYSPAGQGFDEFYVNIPWWMHDGRWANYRADGSSLDANGEWLAETTGDRLDDETQGALAFINRNHDKPFFLYLAYSGPHTPLAATEERLARFPGEMKERRRIGLAMIATMDDGVGQIMDLLKKYDIEENTLIIFTSDNGAPLKMTKPDDSLIPDPDSPNQYNVGGWDGSLNDPHLGEKGMLTEGGIRVPFVVSWKGNVPEGVVYDQPVSSLDIAPTAIAVAGLPEVNNLDGDNLIPILTGEKERQADHALYWRFWKQSAIRCGDWKLIHLGDGTNFLFNLSESESPELNLAEQKPEKVKELKTMLDKWAMDIKPPGLPKNGIQREKAWYKFYLNH